MNITKNYLPLYLFLLLGLSSYILNAETTVRVEATSGYWSISSEQQSIKKAFSNLNGKNIFSNAKFTNNGYSTNIDGLEVKSSLSIVNHDWCQLAVTVHNPSSDTLFITSFEPFTTHCEDILKGASVENLNIMWESPIYSMGRAKNHESHYYCTVYSEKDKSGPAWTLTYRPPQLWTSMLRKSADKLTAYVNFHNRKFPVEPGETITFDPLLLSAKFSAMEGWQAIGKLYKPSMDSAKAVENSGYNTWDFFRGQISSEVLKPILSELKCFNDKQKTPLRYFTLDDGWFPQRGSWEFDEKKFPEGESGWVKAVQDAGMVPGVWIAPFWSNLDKINECGLTILEEVPTDAIRYRVDPSDPKVRKYVMDRFRKLSQAGYKYFKIDFLNLAYTDKPYKYSKFHPERVIREFIMEIRQAIGEDSFLLGCSTVVAPCAMVCDGARIMSDITQNWNVTKDIYKRIAYRYWMNGNLFITDPDFFVGRGPETLKPGASPGIGLETGSRQYEGFDYTKAKTWATMCFVLGGHFNWADQPSGVKSEIWDLASVLAQEGPGTPGIPLDLMETEYPTKWLRTNNGEKYLALMNVTDGPLTIHIKQPEVAELEGKLQLQDIFTQEKINHSGGDLTIQLKAFESKCLKFQK